ncbi:MAG TPA: hypothetical protein PK149_12875 [Flavobacteriales bacterium]|nr:hypothetical protein [Flavobacteriales bacterium]
MNEHNPDPKKKKKKKKDSSIPLNTSDHANSKAKEVGIPEKKEREDTESTEAEKNEEKPVTPKGVKGDHGAPQPATNPGPQGIH